MRDRKKWPAALLCSVLLMLGVVALAVPAHASGPPWSCTVTGNTSCPAGRTDGTTYHDYPGLVMSNGYNEYVANNCWADPNCAQTLNANSGTDWQVTANEPAGNGSVMTGPEIQQQTNDWCVSEQKWWDQTANGCSDLGNVPLSALSSWTSTYAEAIPHNSQTIAEAAYDVWTNYPSDIMVWNDTVNRCNSGAFGGTTLGTGISIGGNTYDAYRYGGAGAEIIFVLEGSGGAGTCAQVSSGSADILGILNWVSSNVTPITDVSLIDYTFEVCSTGGANENFTLSSYSLSTTTGTGTSQAPVATTSAATGVSSSAATLNGSVNPEGQATTYQFDYGTTTGYGSSVPSPAGSAGSGSSAVSENASLTGLQPSTAYHYRIEATNATGTTFGSDQTFTTTAAGQAPAATTTAATSVTSAGATLNGSVNPNGQAATYQFDYGTTTAYGTSAPSPAGSAGSGTTAVNENQAVTGLSPSTVYHYRIEATNATGTTFGADQTFTTAAAPTGVTYVSAAPGSAGAHVADNTHLAWTHTLAAGTNRELTVEAAAGTTLDTGCSMSVKDNGTAMSRLATIHSDNQTAGYMNVYGLVNPPAGANNITVDMTSCPQGVQELTGGSMYFTGVKQTGTYGTVVTNAGYSASASAATTGSFTGDMMTGYAANGSAINSVAAPATARFIANQDGRTGAGNSAGATEPTPGTGAGVSFSWDNLDDWWGAVIVPLHHA